MEKIAFERRVYESVDDRSLSYRLYLENRWKKNNSGHKGLIIIKKSHCRCSWSNITKNSCFIIRKIVSRNAFYLVVKLIADAVPSSGNFINELKRTELIVFGF